MKKSHSLFRLRYGNSQRGLWIDELLALLSGVERHGSLNGAVRALGMNYRRAWQLLEDAGVLFGESLTTTAVGGAKGGGSILTAHGAQLKTILSNLIHRFEKDERRLHFGAPFAIDAMRTASLSGLPGGRYLLIASSTEPVESGLLDTLSEACAAETGIRARHLSVGSGEALALAAAGRVDAAITHAPLLEQKLSAEGLAEGPLPFMVSDFAVVACEEDPAGLNSISSGNLEDYFAEIRRSGTTFVTRNDRSGTHLRELEVWSRVEGGPPDTESYLPDNSGTGTRHAVETAISAQGYTIADRLVVETLAGLRVFVGRNEVARNVYSLIIPTAGTDGYRDAVEFGRWLLGSTAKRIIERAGAQVP